MELERYIEPGTSSPDELQENKKHIDSSRDLKRILKIGETTAADIKNAQKESEDFAEQAKAYRENAEKLRTKANRLEAGFGDDSKSERGKLIVWIIVHALAWVAGLFVTELINSAAGEVLWVLLIIVVLIISAVNAIRAIVSMVSQRNSEKNSAEDSQKKAADCEQAAELNDKLKKRADDKVAQLISERGECLILKEPFRLNPNAYAKGYEAVVDDLAATIEEVNEYLQKTS